MPAAVKKTRGTKQSSAGGFAKGRLSRCKRPSFTVQKATFRTVKGDLLDSNMQPVDFQRNTNGCPIGIHSYENKYFDNLMPT